MAKKYVSQKRWNYKHRKEQNEYHKIYHKRIRLFAHKYMKEHGIKKVV